MSNGKLAPYPSEYISVFFYINSVRYFFLLTSVFLFFGCASTETVHTETLYENIESSYDAKASGYKIQSAALRTASLDRGMLKVDAAPQERMVNYNGNISLESPKPETIIDTVVQKAKEKGATVNSRSNGFVSLQIPVAEFKNFFNYILTLGHVKNKSISASDITDAYTNNAERLRIAENTLARLQELLAIAKTEQEKVALLKEMQRVSEQIEQAKLTEKELQRMAAFSTINLRVNNTPLPIARSADIKAFIWFQFLFFTSYDFKDLVGADSDFLDIYTEKAIKLNVPQNFIEIKNSKKEWRAASALNSEFLAFEIKNEPQGSVDFWANAMLNFFKNKYKAELKTEDNFSLIRLQSSHAEPVVYYIAILKKSDKKTLKIATAKFLNIEAENKDSEAIIEVLRRAGN